MKQQKIKYRDIMNLGFKEEFMEDTVYFDQYGYKWAVVTKKLAKRIYLDWTKEDQLCEMIRVDKEKNILKRMPIRDLDHLKEIVDFFCDDKVYTDVIESTPYWLKMG